MGIPLSLGGSFKGFPHPWGFLHPSGIPSSLGDFFIPRGSFIPHSSGFLQGIPSSFGDSFEASLCPSGVPSSLWDSCIPRDQEGQRVPGDPGEFSKKELMTPTQRPDRCHPPRTIPHTQLCLQIEVGTLAPRPKEPKTLPELGETTAGTPKLQPPSGAGPVPSVPIPGQGESCSNPNQGGVFFGEKTGIFVLPAALCSLLTQRGRRAAEREISGKEK